MKAVFKSLRIWLAAGACLLATSQGMAASISQLGTYSKSQGCWESQCLWLLGEGVAFTDDKGPYCVVNYYHGDPSYGGVPLASVTTRKCGSNWLNAEVPASLSLRASELKVTISGANGESAPQMLSLSSVNHPVFHLPGQKPGDAAVGNSMIVLGTSGSHGGAINYLSYKGYQIVDTNIGTNFQTAYTLNWQGEGLNPTESGSADNANFTLAEADSILSGDRSYCVEQNVSYTAKSPSLNNPNYYFVYKPHASGQLEFCVRNPQHASSTSDTQIRYFKSFPGMIESNVAPAYWLRPGEIGSQNMATEGRAINTAVNAFDQTLAKRVIVGYRGNPNIISYQNQLTLPPLASQAALRSFDKLPLFADPNYWQEKYPDTDYFQMNFYSVLNMKRPFHELNFFPTLVYDPASKAFRFTTSSECESTTFGVIPAQLCNFTQPVIMPVYPSSTPGMDAVYVGVFAPDQAEGFPMYTLQQMPGSAVNAIGAVFDYRNYNGLHGTHNYLTFYVVGNYAEVTSGLYELITEYKPNSKARVCELPYRIANQMVCP